MKNTLFLLVFILLGFQGKAQCTDLFFSEYIEGSSYNKALEIYNPTAAIIDLSDYKISIAFNGATEASGTFVLAGMINPGDVYVICHPSADAAMIAESDLTYSLLFNGNDAVWIEKISTEDTLDIIGIVGNDPGSFWTVTGGNTKDHTIVRDMSIQQGNTNWATASAEWNAFPTNTTTYIGAHTMTPCDAEPCITTTASITVIVCDSYTVPSGDETYTESGIYEDIIPNVAGCDSIITIDLTVNHSTTNSITESVCGSYTVPSGDETHTESGIYLDTIPNSVGCDSIITINLTVNLSTTSTITETVCDSYTVPSGDETYTESGVYLDIIPNMAGCDSLITINLTVNSSSTNVITVTVCDSYTVPSGDATYTESGTYIDILENAMGCDSLITINLTVNTVDITTTLSEGGTVITANASGATYQWLDCDDNQPILGETNQSFTATENGNYAVILTKTGCTDTSDCVAISTLGINEPKNTLSYNLYPNPTAGQFTINGLNSASETSITIYEIATGKLVLSTNSTGKNTYSVNEELPSGTYIIMLVNENITAQLKLIIN